jgi:DNA primase catalytic subunit
MTRWGGYTSSWVRPSTRVGIYLRDGLCCAYCMQDWSVAGLTIDHIVERTAGGTNELTNLISACMYCNGLRRNSGSWERFAEYLKVDAGRLQRRIKEQAQPLTAHIRRRANLLVKTPPAWLQELRRLNTNWSPQIHLGFPIAEAIEPPPLDEETIPF